MELNSKSKELERDIRAKLQLIKHQIAGGIESEIVVWVIHEKLACAQRPLRYHPQFGGYNPLPPQARLLVVEWVKRIKHLGFRSIICLLEVRQLDRYYMRGGINLHENGLFGYYKSQGFRVCHFPMTDYQRPQESSMEKILLAYNEFPKPVLLHCSAGIDRSAPVAAYIALNQRNV
jgi:protein tyrosine phosphatase (PTP) superfamily phosphohydrolase (DUF442 family)